MSELSISLLDSEERSMAEHPPPAAIPYTERSTPKPTTEYLRARWPVLLDAAYMARGLPRRAGGRGGDAKQRGS